MTTTEHPELDISSLWSWTLPLWGLGILIVFVGGAITQDVVVPRYTGARPVQPRL